MGIILFTLLLLLSAWLLFLMACAYSEVKILSKVIDIFRDSFKVES